MDVTPPNWLNISVESYKKLLNRTAVKITKNAKKYGATYQVKEAIDAIDEAFHQCDGTDPYDGLPLNIKHLEPEFNAEHVADSKRSQRWPTVCPSHDIQIAKFEITSMQTKTAKGAMNAEEFIAYCRAVVDHADSATRNQ